MLLFKNFKNFISKFVNQIRKFDLRIPTSSHKLKQGSCFLLGQLEPHMSFCYLLFLIFFIFKILLSHVEMMSFCPHFKYIGHKTPVCSSRARIASFFLKRFMSFSFSFLFFFSSF